MPVRTGKSPGSSGYWVLEIWTGDRPLPPPLPQSPQSPPPLQCLPPLPQSLSLRLPPPLPLPPQAPPTPPSQPSPTQPQPSRTSSPFPLEQGTVGTDYGHGGLGEEEQG
ncbi:hypothetical protein DACRYDRAFT_110120 [Dacryopinax primogenitus]|uniref:Uncharacterized protein n=1 Tax=Dacryopinax primogenitus (strain DJM 731) TaxID=1858805 RepID=M5G6K5_DACPD|nr:uncharacterized protein DACRYDRAFT_110120 [Dacryopinax primogenitus]EJT99397.1 hypothetical protein DACRYDRAFT_110120 [Dacryopinax primogenitus]